MNLLTGLLVLSPFTAIIIGVYSFYLFCKKKLEFKRNYWTIGLFSLFIWSAIVGILNKSLLSTTGSLLILIYFLSSQFANNVVMTKDILHSFMNRIVFYTTIGAIIGVIEKIIFAFMGYGKHRVYSLFGNPNMTGCWFVITLLTITYLSLQKSEKLYYKRYVISSLLITIALLLTGSRGSFAALVGTGIVVSVLRGIKFNRKSFFIAIFIVSAIFIVAFAESNLISEYIMAHPFEDSLNPRMKIWKDAILMIKAKPLLGWGLLAPLELGAKVLPNYNMATIHVHNLWLTFLSTTGIVGLLIYAFMKISLYKDLLFLYKLNKELSLLIFSINLVIIIQGFVDVSLFAPQIGIVYSISGAIVTKLVSENKIRAKEIIIKNRNQSLFNKNIA